MSVVHKVVSLTLYVVGICHILKGLDIIFRLVAGVFFFDGWHKNHRTLMRDSPFINSQYDEYYTHQLRSCFTNQYKLNLHDSYLLLQESVTHASLEKVLLHIYKYDPLQ